MGSTVELEGAIEADVLLRTPRRLAFNHARFGRSRHGMQVSFSASRPASERRGGKIFRPRLNRVCQLSTAAHILVVDDEPEISELLRRYLSAQGYSVSTAPGGAEMRRILGETEVDLLLLDLGLPGEDGLALMRSLREYSSIPVIVVTGRGEAIDRILGLEIGADDYVTKPFDVRELGARVRSVLRRS